MTFKKLKQYKKIAKKEGIITTSNHVFVWDYLVLRSIVRFPKPKVLIWEKNNTAGLSRMYHLAGCVPITSNVNGFKKLYRAYDKETGYAIADILCEKGQEVRKENLLLVSPVDYLKTRTINNFELVELQKEIFKDGVLVYDDPDILEKRAYCEAQMQTLYPEVKRTKMPHEYHVSGTEEYVNLKRQLILEHRNKVR